MESLNNANSLNIYVFDSHILFCLPCVFLTMKLFHLFRQRANLQGLQTPVGYVARDKGRHTEQVLWKGNK